jgi:hypothetical protein
MFSVMELQGIGKHVRLLLIVSMMCGRQVMVAGFGLMLACSSGFAPAATVTVPLDAEADLTSHFITYWAEGIARLDRTYLNTTNQPFWSTVDPTRTYNNSFDFFPNDRVMKFGVLTYDDSELTGGSGSTPITGLTLGIERDPLDNSYINGSWLDFSTDLESYDGEVTVVNGSVASIDLTASYTSLGYFGSAPATASGSFTITGDRFQVFALGETNEFFGDYDPSMEWSWTGTIFNLNQPIGIDSADFNGDGTVNLADYTVWRDSLGAMGIAPHALGDADGDGQVTAADYGVWKSQFGGPPPAGLSPQVSSVPEPTGVVTAILVAMAPCWASGAWARSSQHV